MSSITLKIKYIRDIKEATTATNDTIQTTIKCNWQSFRRRRRQRGNLLNHCAKKKLNLKEAGHASNHTSHTRKTKKTQ